VHSRLSDVLDRDRNVILPHLHYILNNRFKNVFGQIEAGIIATAI